MGRIKTFVDWVHDRTEPVRIGITALIGTIAAFVTYEIVFFLNGFEPRATISWAVAFTIGVFRQHHLHRLLSFPSTRVRYGVSLQRDWLASVVVLVFSAALNFSLTERFGLFHRHAWALCLMGSAVLEYGLLKFFVFRRYRQQRSSR